MRTTYINCKILPMQYFYFYVAVPIVMLSRFFQFVPQFQQYNPKRAETSWKTMDSVLLGVMLGFLGIRKILKLVRFSDSVLLRFTRCHSVSLGVTRCHLVSLGVTRFHLDSVSRHLVSLAVTRFHLVSLGVTWCHLVSLGVTWCKPRATARCS